MINGDDYGIYRVNIDGSVPELVVKAFGSMRVVDEQIYFRDEYDDSESKNYLHRCDLEGNDIITIINKPVYGVNVFKDGIIYEDETDGLCFHICSLDGTNDRKLTYAES